MASLLDLLSQQQAFLKTRQALVVLGLQNDFTSPTGKLPINVNATFFDSLNAIIPDFRKNGDIIWVRSEYSENRPVNQSSEYACTVILDGDLPESQDQEDAPLSVEDENDQHLVTESTTTDNLHAPSAPVVDQTADHPQDQSAVDEELFLTQTTGKAACCISGSSGAECSPEIFGLIDHSKDIQLIKSHYSAFTDTNLLLTLRAKLITEVYLVGCFTNLSMYATATDAARHGLTINLVEDCLGFRRLERHHKAMQLMVHQMGAFITTSQSVISRLKGEEVLKPDPSPTPEDVTGGVSLVPQDQGLPLGEEQSSSVCPLSLKTENPWHPTGSPLSNQFTSTAPGSHRDHAATERGEPPCPRSSDPTTELVVETHHTLSRPIETPSIPVEAQQLVERPLHKTVESAMEDSDAARYLEHKRHASHSPDAPTYSLDQVVEEGLRGRHHDSSSPSSFGVEHSSLSRKRRSVDQGHPTTVEHPQNYTPTDSNHLMTEEPQNAKQGSHKKAKHSHQAASKQTLGPGDEIGSGDSSIVYDLLSVRTSRSIFGQLLREVRWQRMRHSAGEVPRLVCCQGDVDRHDGSMPVYRHPSDESLPVLHWSPSVARVKKEAEKRVGHNLNHVLIQCYRDGTDHISEHTDKTLDIVRGSKIVNASFGAQRTMRLRTKRKRSIAIAPEEVEQTRSDIAEQESINLPLRPSQNKENEQAAQQRHTQRVPMPHNSIFILGPQTNSSYLHGIQPDKRMSSDRSPAELAYGGYRISLTFRQIGTYLSHDSSHIWGQGATAKSKEGKRRTINGQEQESQQMINAFGTENQSTDFDWEATYGVGSDVLHLKTSLPDKEKPILFLSDAEDDNEVVRLWARHVNVDLDEVTAPAIAIGNAADDTALIDEHGESVRLPSIKIRPCLRNSDILHTQVEGTEAVLLYLSGQQRGQEQIVYMNTKAAKELELLTGPLIKQIRDLAHTTDSIHMDTSPLYSLEDQLGLMQLCHCRIDEDRPLWLAGPEFGPADCAFFPLIQRLRAKLEAEVWSTLPLLDQWMHKSAMVCTNQCTGH